MDSHRDVGDASASGSPDSVWVDNPGGGAAGVSPASSGRAVGICECDVASGEPSCSVVGDLFDWVFGYGSIINNLSRASTATSGVHQSSNWVLPVRLRPTFGMVRCWNFRSSTGFTAVGLRSRAEGSEPAVSICGVLFAASGSMSAFDEREAGYERVRLPVEDLDLQPAEFGDPSTDGPVPTARSTSQSRLLAGLRRALCSPSPPRFWVYVPLAESRKPPSENFPICQTYVDTVLQGCLTWGGLALAREWVATTFDWSPFFLNDAPLSRRPWLHRERHTAIDEVLVLHSEWTRFAERRHPEEFASHWMSGLRGMWGVPPRNVDFVGRDVELERIRNALQNAQGSGESAVGVTTIETVGLGGVGKTQTAIEYCYRHYQTASDDCGYGLIVWLQAESPDSIAAGFRDLAADSGIVVKDLHNEEIIDEMRARLYRTGCPWLIVFDNVETQSVLDAYMPRGGFAAGHILVTARRALHGVPSERRVSLDCFRQEESLDFLRRTVGAHASESWHGSPASWSSDVAPVAVGCLLADALGHLPLALAMAAGYMVHCDVTCAEYYESLRASESEALLGTHASGQKLSDYPMGVRESLLLSLRRMTVEENEHTCSGHVQALHVLNCLCFFAPDGISKPLLTLLVQNLGDEKKREAEVKLAQYIVQRQVTSIALPPTYFTVIVGAVLALWLRANTRRRGKTNRAFAVTASILSFAALAAGWCRHVMSSPAAALTSLASVADPSLPLRGQVATNTRVPGGRCGASVEGDRIWMLLKVYSLLAVRDRVGSMHRLLQQLLRALQDEEQTVRSLVCCVRALQAMWGFDPADTTTWAAAGKLLEHVKAIGSRIDELLRQSSRQHDAQSSSAPTSCTEIPRLATQGAADLLTQGGLYMSMALSRFDEADVALEMAMRMHRARPSVRGPSRGRRAFPSLFRSVASAATPASSTSSSCSTISTPVADDDADVDIAAEARTLHTRGKVARYRGRLGDAGAYLSQALEIRRRRASLGAVGTAGYSLLWDVAASLHELGVLRLKEMDFDEAEALLRESLEMKRALKTKQVAPTADGGRSQRFSDEAATLHQLAVVAMLARPCRLDEAEALLKEALALETSGNPFGRGGRAASLQQLARVEIRRGLLDAAQGHLQEALTLHRQAYGQDTPHVNVAAVKTQLGTVACSLAQKAHGDEAATLFAEAVGHLLDALRCQQKIYGAGAARPGTVACSGVSCGGAGNVASECDHLEIASTLGQLGILERARGALHAARRYVVRQREMIVRLLASTHGFQFEIGIPFPASLASSDRRAEQHLRRLLCALQWERTVTRDLHLRADAKALSVSIREILKALDGARGRTPPETEESAEPQASLLSTSDLCRSCVASREQVRQAMVDAKRSKTPPPQDYMIAIADNLASVVARAESSTCVAGDNTFQVPEESIGGGAMEASSPGELLLRSAAVDFCRELRKPEADKFAACDILRATLRRLEVADVS